MIRYNYEQVMVERTRVTKYELVISFWVYIFCPVCRSGVGGRSVYLDGGHRITQYNIHSHLARRINLIFRKVHHRFSISSIAIPRHGKTDLLEITFRFFFNLDHTL